VERNCLGGPIGRLVACGSVLASTRDTYDHGAKAIAAATSHGDLFRARYRPVTCDEMDTQHAPITGAKATGAPTSCQRCISSDARARFTTEDGGGR